MSHDDWCYDGWRDGGDEGDSETTEESPDDHNGGAQTGYICGKNYDDDVA